MLHGTSAQSTVQLAVQLKEFISAAQYFVKFALSSHFADLFLSTPCTSNRLLHYGILSHFTHTRLFLHLPLPVTQQLELVILQLQTKLNSDQLQALEQGTLQIPTRRFKGLCAVKCTKEVKALSRILGEHCAAAQLVARHPQPGKPTAFCCPQGHTRPAGPPFNPLKPGKQVWCNRCARPVAGCQWVCVCGKVWSTCSEHFSSALPPPPSSSSSSSDQPQPPHPPVQSIRPDHVHPTTAEDAQLQRLEPHRASRLVLGPKMAARFPHLQFREL
eukprot:8800929-Karenia_brevis.AAC.1